MFNQSFALLIAINPRKKITCHSYSQLAGSYLRISFLQLIINYQLFTPLCLIVSVFNVINVTIIFSNSHKVLNTLGQVKGSQLLAVSRNLLL